MTDVRVNNISVTFKVDIHRCRGNGSLRKYPTDFGSAGGQHARQETVWTKWCSARLEGKAHSNFISEVAQMWPGYICESSRAPAIKGLHLLSVLYNLECYPTTAIKQEYSSSFT